MLGFFFTLYQGGNWIILVGLTIINYHILYFMPR